MRIRHPTPADRVLVNSLASAKTAPDRTAEAATVSAGSPAHSSPGPQWRYWPAGTCPQNSSLSMSSNAARETGRRSNG
jgi:hypothetical protein